jgi:hypothetical protein
MGSRWCRAAVLASLEGGILGSGRMWVVPHCPGQLTLCSSEGLGHPWGQGVSRGPSPPSASSLPQPCLKSRALIAAFSCATERKEEKTPTYVVPTQDSDMLTSLLYPVSNLNTEGVLCRSGKLASNGSLWAGSLPPPGCPRPEPHLAGSFPRPTAPQCTPPHTFSPLCFLP